MYHLHVFGRTEKGPREQENTQIDEIEINKAIFSMFVSHHLSHSSGEPPEVGGTASGRLGWLYFSEKKLPTPFPNSRGM